MNKLAEKISPVMNEDELQQLISDHYLGEAQLLTTGAEENLLKLAELRGVLDEVQSQRWAQIKRDFLRNKAMGADDSDVGGRVVAQLADIASALQLPPPAPEAIAVADPAPWPALLEALHRLSEARPAAAPPPVAAAPACRPRPWPKTSRRAWRHWWSCWRHRRRSRCRCRRPWPRSPAGRDSRSSGARRALWWRSARAPRRDAGGAGAG